MRREFDSNAEAYKEVVEILKQTRGFRSFDCDLVTTIDKSTLTREEASSEGMIVAKQWDDLCELRSKLSLSDPIGMAEDRSEIMFWLETYGLVTGGRIVGIMYSEVAPGRIFDSIDSIPQAQGRYYSPLAVPRWYILWWID